MTPVALLLLGIGPIPNQSQPIESGGMPYRIHVIEDYETEIERRWWLRGQPETDNLPPSRSDTWSNTRACRATETKDFDQKMGDQSLTYKAVIFNPVPGPPMGSRTRLSFRYWLSGTDTLRVQIYSLTNNYHRHLVLTGLTPEEWQHATVDMTNARRPDGSGEALAEDERIDDIQFYIPSEGELIIDDIVLYEAAVEGEERPFPTRPIFTAWFDTGKQGEEWPGDFEIVLHEKPLTWDAAKSVAHPKTGHPWLRVAMRGQRPLGEQSQLRFRYRLVGANELEVWVVNSESGERSTASLTNAVIDQWTEATLDYEIDSDKTADEIHFRIPEDGTLWIDDLLLFEP